MVTQDCVRGALIRKTVILVTHQVEFLHNADLILVCYLLSSPSQDKSLLNVHCKSEITIE